MATSRPLAVVLSVVMVTGMVASGVTATSKAPSLSAATECEATIVDTGISQTSANPGEQVSASISVALTSSSGACTDELGGTIEAYWVTDRGGIHSEAILCEVERASYSSTDGSLGCSGSFTVPGFADLNSSKTLAIGYYAKRGYFIDESYDRALRVPVVVSGEVTKEHFGTPITDARIYFEGEQIGQTDDRGQYRVGIPVGEGTYELEFERSGVDDEDVPFSVGDDHEITRNVVMGGEASVFFTVMAEGSIDDYDWFSGDPITTASVTFDGQTKSVDSDGEVTFSNVDFGVYDYAVSAPGWSTLSGTQEIRYNGGYAISAPLVPEGSGVLDVDVVDLDGNEIDRSQYTLLVDGRSADFDAQNRVVLEAGTYELRLEPADTASELTTVTETVTVESGKRTVAELMPVYVAPPLTEADLEVLRINSNELTGYGFHHDSQLESIRIRVTDANGRPIEQSSIRVGVDVWARGGEATLTHVGDGVYEGSISGLAWTQYGTFEFWFPDEPSETVAKELPLVYESSALKAPIRGWYTSAGVPETVSVAGQTYKGVKACRVLEDGSEECGYLAFDSEGRLVSNDELRRKIGVAAAASDYQGNTPFTTEFLGEEYPQTLSEVLTLAELSELALVVRDTAAEALGWVLAIQTGGAGKVGGKAVSEVTVDAAKKDFARKFSNNLIETYVGLEGAKSDPLGELEKGMKAYSTVEVRESIQQSNEASEILRDHELGETWTYTEANEFWTKANESLVDGYFFMTLRVNLLPDASFDAQLEDVMLKVADGLTDLPVSTLFDLIVGGQLGYISDTVEETSVMRVRMAEISKEYGVWSQDAQAAARSQHGSTVILGEGAVPPARADISIASGPSGTFVQDEQVQAEAVIENTGEKPHRFFVGYSAFTDVSGSRTYFDNGGTTGSFVSLAPGETATVPVSWTVESAAPTGQRYGYGVAAWPGFPERGMERLDDEFRTDAFSVEQGATFEVRSIDVPETVTAGERITVIAEVENTGAASGTKLVDLRVGDETIDKKAVSVDSGVTETVSFRLNVSEPGEYELASGSSSIEITVVPRPLCDGCDSPSDIDGDGRYEDVDGDGQLTFFDVLTLYDYFQNDAEPIAVGPLDFDENGDLTFFDVLSLYDEFQSS